MRSRFHISLLVFTLGLIVIVLTGAYSDIGIWKYILAWIILYIHLLIAGATFIQLNFYTNSINHGNRNSKHIYLSFDDGPNLFTAKILDVLQAENVKAAFYIIGKNIAGKEHLLIRMQNEGHLIGNHSDLHGFNFDWKSSASMLEEMDQCNQSIKKVIRLAPSVFRPPYGVTNPNLAKAIRLSGMQSVGWSLRSYDTMAKDGMILKNKILKKLKGGDIILLHDSMEITASILTELIRESRKMGFIFADTREIIN